MATLIQSKQIEGIITASNISGDFTVTGDIIAAEGTSSLGDIIANSISSSGPIYGVRYDDIQGTPNFVAGSGIVITQVGDTITITNSGGGSGVSGSVELISSVTQLESYTGSNDIIITGLQDFSASIQAQVDSLTSATSSYLTELPSGLISSSDQLISSLDERYSLGGSSGGGDSVDISSLNDFTQSSDQRISSIENFSSSVESRLSTLEGQTDDTGSDSQTLSIDGNQITISDGNTITIPTAGGSSIPSGTISGSEQVISSLPSGVVSGSSQITDDSGIVSSSEQIISLLPSGIISSSAQIDKTWTLGADGSSHYTFTGPGLTGTENHPTLYLTRGETYRFVNNMGAHPFRIQLEPNGSAGTQYNDGVTNNDVSNGTLIIDVQFDAPSRIYYQCTSHPNMGGVIEILDKLPSGLLSGSVLEDLSSSLDSRITSLENQTDDTGSDSQTLSIDGNQITISGGNTITIPSGGDGGGVSDFSQLSNVPSRLISSSQQILDLGFVSESVTPTDISSLNNFTSSIELRVDELSSATSSYLTTLPDGIISGSTFTDYSSSVESRLTILENQNDDTGSDNQTLTFDPLNQELTISDGNSVNLSSLLSDSGSSIWSSASDYYYVDADLQVTGSIRLDGIFTASAVIASTLIGSLDYSELVNVPNLLSSSIQILDLLPSGLVSSSNQLTSSFDERYLSKESWLVESASFDNRINNIASTGVPAGTISSSQQIIDSLPSNIFSGSILPGDNIEIDSSSGDFVISSTATGSGSGDVSFNGNRIISQEKLPDLFSSSFNPGTSGSVQDFLNAVFYPNSEPTITTGNQTIIEYTPSGSIITTLTGTDPEGQTLTFGTASSYTDDLVRVESNGVLTLNALAESSSFNTDLIGGIHGHTFTATVTDTFNATVEKDITVFVTPNSTPVFRETSTSGNIITSVTSNLNENSINDTLVKRIYFTDANGDDITIHSSSVDNNHFDITKYSTYVDIRQNTSSLDYELQTTYSFSISASDEHYEAGQDSDSIANLPITINIVDNTTPNVNDQTLSSINENSSNGVNVGTISAADSEGDTITFKNFELHQLLLDGIEVSSGSYGGSSQLTDPHENPFQMSTSGVVTRKTGVYLNSDLINTYIYRVQVTDSFNIDSNVALITINIIDDTPATIFDNWSAGPYIKESEISGTTIKTTNYGSTVADYNSNQSGIWSSSNPSISINSNGGLSISVDLSGSTTQSGDTIDDIITFTNDFGTTTTDSISIQVVGNDAPTITFIEHTDKFNTNLATNGTTLVSMSVSDTEDDIPYSASLSGVNASDFNLVYSNSHSSSIGLHCNGDLSSGSYTYDLTVTDSYGKSTTYSNKTINILQAEGGTLTTNGTLYVIESATSGDNIVLGTNGKTGTQGRVSVSYSSGYGDQTVSSFSSSNSYIDIDSSGYLTVGDNISGSDEVAGNTITSTITFTDQYGNSDSDTISVSVQPNNAPNVSNTLVTNNNTNQATGSERILRLTLTDSEGDSIPNNGLSFSGYNTSYFTPSISTPNMDLVVNNTSVPAGTYSYTANIQDEHGFTTNTVTNTFNISQADTGTLSGDTAIYIIESAESGEVFRDQTGYNAGNAAQATVFYSPSYGSSVVQSFTSSNPAIVIDSNGNMTLGVDISGSVTQSGDSFTSDITFTDQYGNVGSGSITATVFGNQSPVASFTATSDYDSDLSISGSTAGTVTITDTEGDLPFSISVGGADGDKFDATSGTSPLHIQPTGSLGVGTYTINIIVTDSYGESITLTGETITVVPAGVYGKVFIYTSTRTGAGTLSDINYNGILGITSEDTSTDPDLITGYQSAGPSPIFEFKDGHLGDSSITVGGGVLTKRLETSGENLDTIVSSSFSGDGTTAEQILVIFPSGSDMNGIPTSMTDSLGGSTVGEYVLYLKAAGESGYTVGATQIHMFDVDSAVEGFTRWNIIGRNSVNTASSYEIRIIPSSGSAP